MNVYDKLLKLQVIENAWEEWAAYRLSITQYLIDNIEEQRELAIFGAGRCNDMDLKRLLMHFDHLVLVDLDKDSMQEALKKQGLENEPRITLITADFVGITPNDYRSFADTLVYTVRQRGLETSMVELTQVAIRELDKLYRQAMEMPLVFKKYKNIAVIGIHSQLISMLDWIWQAILQTLGRQESSVRQKIMAMNTAFIQRFDTALLESAEGQIVMGYEIERIGRPGAVQGAMQGAIDFKERVDRGEIKLCDFSQMDWPFDQKQGIVYHMGIFAVERLESRD